MASSKESSTSLTPIKRIPPEMPAIAVKNSVVFPVPGLQMPLTVGRGKTLRAIEAAAPSSMAFTASRTPGPPRGLSRTQTR
jgi:hypothetical protein